MGAGRRSAAETVTDALFGLGWAAGHAVPEPVARAAFGGVAETLWRRRGAGVRQLEANLARVCPGAGERELRELSRQGMHSYMRYWLEAFRLPNWSPDQVSQRVRVENLALVQEPHDRGQGVVGALPHLGNWDLAGAWACLHGLKVTTVAERLRPERLFQRFVSYREQLGMEVLPVGERATTATLLRRLREGAFVCLVADRDLTSSGVEVELLGERARMPGGPAALARSTGSVLLPITPTYEGDRMRLTLHDPVPHRPGPGGVREMTQQVADVFSDVIRRHPQDWHMLQRVFVADLAAGSPGEGPGRGPGEDPR